MFLTKSLSQTACPDMFVCSLQVIAENLSEDEIAGLKEMFKMIDTDNSGTITFEELKVGLKKVGANLQESEIQALMQAVSCSANLLQLFIRVKFEWNLDQKPKYEWNGICCA